MKMKKKIRLRPAPAAEVPTPPLEETPSPTNPLPLSQFLKNAERPSSEVPTEAGEIVFDFGKVSDTAERLDIEAMLDDEETPRARKKDRQPAAAAGSSSKLEEVPRKTAHDPDFDLMVMFAASKGIDLMKDTFHLIEPGTLTRQRVAKSLARLVERYAPVDPGPLADIACIVGYLGVWAATGRIDEKSTESGGEASQTDNGNDRNRKDNVSMASPQGGAEMFSVRPNGGRAV